MKEKVLVTLDAMVCLAMIALVLALAIVGCGTKGEPSETAPEEGELDDLAELEARLLANHVEGPFVVTRQGDASPAHLGEGILWGGVASYALPCEKNDKIDQALADLVVRHNGALVRYEPLGEYAGGREITWDGAVGFYLAVADSIVRCGRAARWQEPYRQHLAYLEVHHQAYHENSTAAAAPGYDTVHDLIAHRLGLRAAVNHDALTALDVAVAGTNASLAGSPSRACYLANLGFLSLLTARTLGHDLSGPTRDLACHHSRGFDMPTWDHYCGRRSIDEWAHQDFRLNQWEFRHQRCGSRESADGHGDEGWQTPALDRLLAKRLAHGV